jgi:arabinogalactan endo-1,4-beta-galactosidase
MWPVYVPTGMRDTQKNVRGAVSDWGKAIWWMQQAESLGLLPFDILGVSYYQQWLTSYTSGGPLNTLQCACSWCLSAVQAAYPRLPIVIVETAYPFEPYANTFNFTETNADFPFTPAGQHHYLARLVGAH